MQIRFRLYLPFSSSVDLSTSKYDICSRRRNHDRETFALAKQASSTTHAQLKSMTSNSFERRRLPLSSSLRKVPNDYKYRSVVISILSSRLCSVASSSALCFWSILELFHRAYRDYFEVIFKAKHFYRVVTLLCGRLRWRRDILGYVLGFGRIWYTLAARMCHNMWNLNTFIIFYYY